MSAGRPPGASSEYTRSAILDLVRSSGSISRVELAHLSGLTAASITRVVKVLIDAGLVVEKGLADSTGGKRRSLLELNPQARYAVGVSLGDAVLSYVVTDLGGSVVGEQRTDGLGQDAPRIVAPRIASELLTLLTRLDLPLSGVVGVGVAGAGLDLSGDAARMSLTAEEWESYPLQEVLQRALQIPVVRDNDATCAALGEFWAGRIPATRDFATLYAAVGFGLGVMVEGRPLRGASSNVGEIGHMVVRADGPPCWCGAAGCLEIVAGPRAVVAEAMRRKDLVGRLHLSGDDRHLRHDFDAIAQAALRGEAESVRLIERSARAVAAAMLSVVNLLDLDLIRLAGPTFAVAGPLYQREIRDLVQRCARARSAHGIDVEVADPNFDATAVGAASLALQHVLTPHARAAGAPTPAVLE